MIVYPGAIQKCHFWLAADEHELTLERKAFRGAVLMKQMARRQTGWLLKRHEGSRLVPLEMIATSPNHFSTRQSTKKKRG